MPLTLGIAVGSKLVTSFAQSGTASPEVVSAVTPSTSNGQNIYTVTVPSGTYVCSPYNTTVSSKNTIGTETYVLGA